MAPGPTDAATGSRFQTLRAGLARVWRPNGWSGPVLLFWPFGILAPALSLSAVALSTALVITSFFGHRTLPALVFFALAVASSVPATTQATGLWLAFRLGRWKGFGGKFVPRAEQPLQF